MVSRDQREARSHGCQRLARKFVSRIRWLHPIPWGDRGGDAEIRQPAMPKDGWEIGPRFASMHFND